jgi:tetratricopeptide (TPR) repeat protein
MTIIPLRAYNREIEGLIDNSQLDEAVAHCRHILATYPKYIASYRLLGKAHLEQQRISDATDIFQRVLSSVPDDFIANVGMSIIREDENNLDAAIWHMELAYEAQPANVAIQDELRRLYGRRDGVQPPKVRLTRGALARMYSKGGLFDQAIAELRSAIAEDPNRPDLQLLLAEMYYQTEQRIEAIEACANIIKKIPFCLIANRILAISLSEAEGSEAVKNYQQIVISLDPYYAFAVPETISSDQVPENAVNIERLDWKSGIQVGETPVQPDWANSLGVSIEKPIDENLPEWLKSAEAPEISPSGEKPAPSVSPFIWDTQEVEKIITDTSKPEGEIPDWMKDAGWQPATGEATPPPDEGTSEEPLTGLPADENIEQAEIPDWLRGIAPEGPSEETPQTDRTPEADLSSPWLEQHQPGPTDSIIEWLDETKPETKVPPVTPDEDLSAALDEEIPDWLKDLEVPSAPSDQESEPSQPEAVAQIPAVHEETPTPEAPETLSSTDELKREQLEETTTTDVEAMPSVELESSTPMETSEKEEILPSELENVSSFEIPEREESLQAETAELSSSEGLTPEELAAESLDEIPDWLRDLAEEQPSPEAPSIEPEELTVEASALDLEPEVKPTDVSEHTPVDEQGVPIQELPTSLESFELYSSGEREEPHAEIDAAPKEPSQGVSLSIEEESQLETTVPVEGEGLPVEPDLTGEPDSLTWLDELTTGDEAIQSEVTGEEASAMAADKIPDWIKGLGEEPEMRETVEQPEVEAELEQPEVEAELEQPVVEAELEQPEVEAELEQPVVEAEQELPVVEALEEPTEVETAVMQPEVESPEEQAELETAIEQLTSEGVEEQREIEAAAEQPAMEAAVGESAQEVTPGKEMPAEEELPGWLLELEEPPAEEEPAASSEETLSWETEELPAWLQEITETEPGSEAPGVTTPTEAELTPQPPEETPQPSEEIHPEKEIIEEAATEASSEPSTWVPEVEQSAQLEGVEPLEAEVPITQRTEEQQLPESEPVSTEPEEVLFTPQVIAEQNRELLAKARASINEGQPFEAANTYDGLIRQNYQLDEIIQDLTEAVYRYPVDPKMWVSLGDAYFRKDQLQEALNAYNKAEELAR